MLKIVFMGTPDFAAAPLRKLLASEHRVTAVYTRAPKPKGRGQVLQKSPVHELAEAHNIPVYTPKSLKRDEKLQEEFANLDMDIAVVAAYGLILPKRVLEAPRFGCLNIHASLLPDWRGAAPIQYAIWKGDTKSGVTIMQMDEGLDTGAMLLKGEVPITLDTTAQTLHDALAETGGDLLLETLKHVEVGTLKPEKQDDAASTFAPMLTKEDGKIDWAKPAAEIDCQVRALNPWPGTYTYKRDGKRLKILKGHVENGRYIIDLLQPDGSKPMAWKDALNGKIVTEGEEFT